MFTQGLKRTAARLPRRMQQELKRLHYARCLKAGTFVSPEPEFSRLGEFVGPGDWALDVGANVGHYTARLSELVGPNGRVVAMEPMPRTFEMLSANAARFPHANVTVLNVAASDTHRLTGMSVPKFQNGLDDGYTAHLSDAGKDSLHVLCVPVDALDLPGTVRLVKIDVEGHEMSAVRGMSRLLERDRPVLIVEGRSQEMADHLAPLGYTYQQQDGSPNRVYLPSNRS